MKLGLPAVWVLPAVLFHFSNVSAQSQQEDSIFYQTALSHTLAIYYDQIGDQSRLLNGAQFPEYEFRFQKGSPYFISDKPQAGSVVYDSVYYPNQLVLFDNYRQFLVVVDQSFKLKLVNERVNAFAIGEHHFIRAPEKNNSGLVFPWYYEVVYSGRSQLLKHSYKKYSEIITVEEGVTRILDQSDYYYIKHGESYVLVNSKRSLLNFMDSHRKEVQKYIRKKGLNYKDDLQNTLIAAASYYDQLDNH